MRFAFIGNVVPIGIATATNFGSHRTVFFLGAAGGCIAPLVVTGVPRRHRIPFYLGAFGGIPALALMQAYTGGPASGYSVLMMMVGTTRRAVSSGAPAAAEPQWASSRSTSTT